MGTAPAATGIVTAVIVGFTSLTIFSIIRGPEAVLHSFMHLTSSLSSKISTVGQKMPNVVWRVYDIVKPVALVIYDILRVVTPIIFGFFFVIFGAIRDSLLALTGVVKAIMKQVEERRTAGQQTNSRCLVMHALYIQTFPTYRDSYTKYLREDTMIRFKHRLTVRMKHHRDHELEDIAIRAQTISHLTTSTIPNDATTVLGVFIIVCLVAPLILLIIGFAPWGVIGGSLAAFIQSLIGDVVAGSLFALLQSLATVLIFEEREE
ncbi:10943_t:CDS:2, partial [Acaulospora colombiana]